MARDLADRVIFITGGSSGIGAATAQACASAGMGVFITAIHEDKLQAQAKKIETAGGNVAYLNADVRDDDAMRRAFEMCWERFGRLDAVYANAGYGQVCRVLAMSQADEQALFETNYFGTTRTLRLAEPYLRKTEGGLRHMLISSSASSEIGVPMLGPYSATKAAQDAMAGALRAELHKEGFEVTTVHPIGTKSNFMATAGAEQHAPIPINQTPEKVAKHVVAALRRPRAEVWPGAKPVLTRLGLALGTAWPYGAAWVMARHYRKLQRADRSKLSPRRPNQSG